MKNIFEAQSFMYRRPVKSMNELSIMNSSEDFSLALKNDPIYLEQLLVASEETYVAMVNSGVVDNKLNDKKTRNLKETLFNYYNRSCTRATPFGLFSMVGIGKFNRMSQYEPINSDLNQIRKKVSIDFSWLEKYILFLEKKYYKKLKFIVNNAVYKMGDRVNLLYCIDEEDNEEISISFTELFRTVQSICKDKFVAYDDILSRILDEYGEEYIDLANNYLNSLISNWILISELMVSPLEKEPLTIISDVIKNVGGAEEEINFILMLSDRLKLYTEDKIGEGIKNYKDIKEFMSKKIKTDRFLQIDLFNSQKVFLSEKTKNEVEEFATFLNYINNQKRINELDKYKDRFLEKYGTEQVVSLTELFDNCVGIGAPHGYNKPSNEYFEYSGEVLGITKREETTYLKLYEEALKENSVICLEKCTELLPEDIDLNKVTTSMELYFKLFQIGKDSEPSLSLSNIVGCNNMGSSFGRFASRFENIDEIYKNLVYSDNNEYNDVKLVEISIIPENKTDANVMRTVNYRDCELPLFCMKSEENTETLFLEDIYIGIDHNEFFALDIKSGKRLIFKKTNMYNTELLCNEIRFLLDISNNYISWFSFPWMKVYENMSFIPEIKYKDITLSPKQWNLHINDIEKIGSGSYGEIQASIPDYFTEKGISFQFLLTVADNEILFDLNCNIDIQVLSITLKKYFRKYGENATIKILEYKGRAGFFKDKSGNYFSSEVVVPLLKRKKNLENMSLLDKLPENGFYKRIPNNLRTIQPFDGWLYLKLYMKAIREDEFIVKELESLIFPAKNGNKFNYFFVRYEDPKPHLRLRIKGKREDLIELYFNILPIIKNLEERCFISEFLISPYDEEIERYGGEKLFFFVQNLFIKDSILVGELLKNIDEGRLANDKELISCILNYLYLNGFYYEFNDLRKFFDIFNIKCISKDSSLKPKKDRLINMIFSGNNSDLLYIRGLFADVGIEVSRINKYMEDNKISVFKKAKIVDSIIHMDNNRFYGIDRQKEIEVMEMAKAVLFRKHYSLGVENGRI